LTAGPDAKATLYSLALSHPSQAARLMLERKGIEHEVVDLFPGLHPIALRRFGFRGGTVPALRLNGRRVQGSRAISHALDELQPEPALFPREPDRRRAVEEAEAWGEGELQPVPRRLFRWAVSHRQSLRRWMVGEELGMPLPGVVAAAQLPMAVAFARMARATGEQARADVAGLPGMLDHVDALIADGTIGADAPNAADFQIGTTVRVLLAFSDLRDAVEGRPAADLALRVLPRYPGPIPPALPREWLAALRT
jgi:glutathione S-transferase